MRRTSIAMILGAVVFLSGCAATEVRTPELVPAPSTWSAQISTAPADAPRLSSWWEELADQQLNQLVEIALRDSADISVAAARVRQARAFAKEAGANRLPQLDVGGVGLRERVAKSSFLDEEGERQTGVPYRRSNLAVRLDARYDIDLLGRLALGERAAAAESAASVEELRAVRQWLAREVVLAYADLRLADERAAISQEASIRLGELLNAEQERLEAGLVARDRVRVAERTLAETRDAQAGFEQERHAALARLANLLGRSSVELQVQIRTDYFARLGLSGAVTPDLPAKVLKHRADVAAAWQRVLAASKQTEIARLERYPALALTGSSGYVTESFRRWLTGDALAWLFQATLQAPLFDGGRVEARTELARAAGDESYAHYRKLVLNALAEAETALSATQSAKTRVHLAEAELVRRVADYEMAVELQSAGIGSRTERVQKEIEQLAAAENLSLTRHALFVAWASTQKALGQ